MAKIEADSIAVKPFPIISARETLRLRWAVYWLGRMMNLELPTRLVNRKYAKAYRSVEIPALDAAGARVLEDLEDNGIAIARLDEFFEGEHLEKMNGIFAKYHEDFRSREKGNKKNKEIYIQTVHREHTFADNDFVSEYLASPRFAAIAAQYLRMVPRFAGNSFWHTYPAPVEDRVYSQRWHRDYNDSQLVKVFLYLNDVEDNGPFEYLTGSHGRGALGRRFNVVGNDGYRVYPEDAAMDELTAPLALHDLAKVPEPQRFGASAPWHKQPARLLCTGKAGTLIFADTYGLHRGGHVRSGYRNMVMTTFSTNCNVHRSDFRVKRDFAKTLDPFMRHVLGVDERALS